MRLGFSLIAAMLACGAEPAPPRGAPHLTTVVVQPGSATLPSGRSLQLAAEADDEGGRPVPGAVLRFVSQDPTLAQVSPQGLVTAAGKTGTARIVVSSGDRSAAAEVTIVPGEPERIEKLRGDAQSGRVRSALAQRLEVRVEDGNGNAVPGAVVRFHTEDGALQPDEVRTSAQGTASALWVLGPGAGQQVASVACGGLSVSFHATAAPGVAARVLPIGGEPRQLAAGQTLEAEALATDAQGNPVPGAEVSWRVVAGKGRVTPEIAPTDATGTSRVKWTTDTAIRRNALVASLAVASDVRAEFEVDTVAGAPASAVAIGGERHSGRAGQALKAQPAVRVHDAHGNAVPGVRVHFSVTAGSGSIEHAEATSDRAGVASAGIWTLGRPGSNTLSAAVEGVGAPVSFSATAR